MEFKNIFVINCSEGFIPHVNNEDDIEEERRLFFVAMTRAIDNLFICSPKNIRNKYSEISRFIDECQLNSVENIEGVYKSGDEIIHSSFGKGAIVSIDKNVVTISFANTLERKFDANMLHNRGLIRKLES
jgi:DNA helicase-2/ATP-dependent DNA helicase PcrA